MFLKEKTLSQLHKTMERERKMCSGAYNINKKNVKGMGKKERDESVFCWLT